MHLALDQSHREHAPEKVVVVQDRVASYSSQFPITHNSSPRQAENRALECVTFLRILHDIHALINVPTYLPTYLASAIWNLSVLILGG